MDEDLPQPRTETSWLEYAATEIDRLVASHHCLACRLSRRAGQALESLANMVNSNADDRTVEAMADSARDAVSMAAGIDHTCIGSDD